MHHATAQQQTCRLFILCVVFHQSAACAQGNVDANVARQNELLAVINKNTAAYRQAFGFREWRQACEVSALTKFPMTALGTDAPVVTSCGVDCLFCFFFPSL